MFTNFSIERNRKYETNPDLITIMLCYSLPESFENFRCAIESRNKLPNPEFLRTKKVLLEITAYDIQILDKRQCLAQI